MTNVASETARIAELTRELDDLRSRQEAVADILRALSGSGMRLQPILDQIVETAARLCRADSGFLYLADGDLLRMRANSGQPAEIVEYERLHPDRPGLGTCTGRVALTKRPVQIPDVGADPDYTYPAAAHVRTLLGLPVLSEDELVGVIGLARSEVRPFEGAEIELMATFADQSAIAIANAELFETVERQKTELARFLSPEIAALISSDEGAQLLAGHRAYITVAYFDLRGFTAFAETAEPEELINVVREYHAVAGELVLAHGGTLEHFAGDGLMVFFNDPVPMPEPELQAAKLALAMRERIGELSGGWRKRGYELGLGAGIAVGHATLGRIGFEGRYDYGALGSVTNLAARLSDEAASEQILLSQRAYAALEGRVEAEPVAELQVKGFARLVQAYELLRVVDLSSFEGYPTVDTSR
jgi:class 3 adenylate cyclase/putative methionine-R-sulfoxide reductase with GAF domain